MAQVGQGPLDSSIAPAAVLRGHADNQVLNLIADMRPAKATLFAAIIFLGDQSAMPGQKRLWCDDSGQFV